MQPGDALPDLRIATTADPDLHLPSLAGNLAVIYFYPKDATPGCTTEARDFAALHPAFSALGARVIGVSRDSLASHARFRERQQLPFELASDGDEAACHAFDVIHEKTLYGRTSLGVVRSTFLFGRDGRLLRAWRGVRVTGHAQAVLDACREAA